MSYAYAGLSGSADVAVDSGERYMDDAATEAGNAALEAAETELGLPIGEYKATLNDLGPYAPGWTPTTTEEAIKWSREALTSYAKDQALDLTNEQIDKIASSYGLEGIELDKLPANEREAAEALAAIAVAAFCQSTGVDPKLAVVTVDALKDGKLTRDEMRDIGAAAGAIAGAAIGQAFGVPAPIGAFIGGQFGAVVGETVADIFGLQSAWQEAWRKYVAALKEEVLRVRTEAMAMCGNIRKDYWTAFDSLIVETERSWEKMELRVGWRFDLRWFGRCYGSGIYGNAFVFDWDADKGLFTGRRRSIQETFAFEVPRAAKPVRIVSDYGDQPTVWRAYECRNTFGCPYPKVPDIGAPSGSGLFGPANRAVGALWARGALWIPPAKRRVLCPLPPPPVVNVLDREMVTRWIGQLQWLINREQQRLQSLSTVAVMVSADLIQTAAMVSAERKIHRNLRRLKQLNYSIATTGLQRVTEAANKSNRTTSIIENTALVGGAALVGAGLLRGRR
jgi:hypothetical protein